MILININKYKTQQNNMKCKSSNQKFKIEIIKKKVSPKLQQNRKNKNTEQIIPSRKYSNGTQDFGVKNIRAQSTYIIRSTENKTETYLTDKKSNDIYNSTQLLKKQSFEFFTHRQSQQQSPYQFTQRCNQQKLRSWDHEDLLKPSEIFSNELMKTLDSKRIRKSLNKITQIKAEDKQSLQRMQTKPKTSLRIFIEANAIMCSSIKLKRPPMHKRNLMVTSKSLATFQNSDGNRKKIKITKGSSSRVMAFHIYDNSDVFYMKKVKSFLDFLFKINFSNRIYISLDLKKIQTPQRKQIHVGNGNNSELVKNILKKRFWFQLVPNAPQNDGIVFYWTQHNLKEIHSTQEKRQVQNKFSCNNIKKNTKSINNQIIKQNKQIMTEDDAYLVQNFITSDGFICPDSLIYTPKKISNHLPKNGCLSQKRKLFKSIFHYYIFHLKKDPFEVIPLTYSIKNCEDPEFKRFLRDQENYPDYLWVIKPGEDSNRGQGIKIAQLSQIPEIIRSQSRKTYILQKYIENPLLYNGRKFDIRHFMLITSVNGIIKVYWYNQGYLRTSSQFYTLEDIDDPLIHLTNDAVQKKSPFYGKFQSANKISYSDFQRYLDTRYSESKIKFDNIINKMKEIVLDVVAANFTTLDHERNQSNFELFGLDFMLDRNFKPWLIQINSNPCLETSGTLLQRIIPGVIEQTLRIGLDPIIPPMQHFPQKSQFGLNDHYINSCKYELIFDELAFNKIIPTNYELLDSDDQFENINDLT